MSSLPFDPAKLSLTDIIRLQNQLSQELARRFETSAALGFVDIVGSTAYFARFGDEAGRQLQQLHLDLLNDCVALQAGRVVDTAGDGAFTCFTTPAAAARAMVALLNGVSDLNEHRERDHQLMLRVGLHWGRVLTDGSVVTGDAVNLAARIAASADPGQIRLSREFFLALDPVQRFMCRSVGAVELRGSPRPMELMSLHWRDPSRFPTTVLVQQTQQSHTLPQQDIISFGRLEMVEGMVANDIVLTLPDAAATRQISRWHFELRRRTDGYMLRSMTMQTTRVDGVDLTQGQEARIVPGTVVEVAGVMTLLFHSPGAIERQSGEATGMITRPYIERAHDPAAGPAAGPSADPAADAAAVEPATGPTPSAAK